MASFQFQYRLGREDFIVLSRALERSGRHRRLLRGAFTVLGVFFGGLGVTYLQRGHYSAGAIIVAIGLFCIFRIYTMGRLSVRRADALAAAVTGERRVALAADGIHIQDEGSEALAPYAGVQRLLYLKQRYFLVFDRQRILMLPLSALTVGEYDALRPFLEEKLGLTVEELT